MADYFEEMGWTPLADGEQPDSALHLARLLLDYYPISDIPHVQWPSFIPPPASKKAIKELKNEEITEQNINCPVCLKEFNIGEFSKKLPCSHQFHSTCIMPWLKKTNSCPLCRHELPTDSEVYEFLKKEKSRAKRREEELETLHNSMFC